MGVVCSDGHDMYRVFVQDAYQANTMLQCWRDMVDKVRARVMGLGFFSHWSIPICSPTFSSSLLSCETRALGTVGTRLHAIEG